MSKDLVKVQLLRGDHRGVVDGKVIVYHPGDVFYIKEQDLSIKALAKKVEIITEENAEDELLDDLSIPLSRTKLPGFMVKNLSNAGFNTTGDVVNASDDRLMNARGVGPATIVKIRAAVDELISN